MEETLKVINVWLETEKELQERSKDLPVVEAYHRGAVAYLTRIGLLLQQSHPTEPGEGGKPDAEGQCSNGGCRFDGLDGICKNISNCSGFRED